MELEILRYSGGQDATLGLLFELGWTRRLWCFTLEDERREVKVHGETRIPAGRYEIKLRAQGTMNTRYKARYPWHRGMLWLQNVPGFEWIYIHTGNTDDHTDGCPLIGDYRDEENRTLGGSRDAYRRVYPRITEAMQRGERVWVTVVDFDRPGVE